MKITHLVNIFSVLYENTFNVGTFIYLFQIFFLLFFSLLPVHVLNTCMSFLGSIHNVCLVKCAQHMHAVSLSCVSVICLAQFVGKLLWIYFYLYMYTCRYTKCTHTQKVNCSISTGISFIFFFRKPSIL